MQNRRRFTPLILCALLTLGGGAWHDVRKLAAADAGTPPGRRIAIVADADTANLAALLTAELSGDATIHLLDRDETGQSR